MMPDYRKDNPYQSLLAKALAVEGVDTVFPVGYRRAFPIYRAVCDNWPIDVLHLHWSEPYALGKNRFSRTWLWMKLLLDLWLVRMAGVRVVWTLHNLLPHECSYPKHEKFFRRRLVQGVSHVIVHGKKSHVDAISILRCPAEKISVIPHGNYCDVYPEATSDIRRQSREGLPDGHRVFLFFGFMRPYKGLERLLRVWNALKPKNASLWLAGPCHDEVYAAALRSEAGKAEGIRVEIEFVNPERVSQLFAGADLVVLPFESVQTSGSVILALSYGKPVIAPRIGEISETLGDASELLYEPNTDRELRDVILRGLSDDLSALVEKSRQACQRLDWTPIGARTAEVYRV